MPTIPENLETEAKREGKEDRELVSPRGLVSANAEQERLLHQSADDAAIIAIIKQAHEEGDAQAAKIHANEVQASQGSLLIPN